MECLGNDAYLTRLPMWREGSVPDDAFPAQTELRTVSALLPKPFEAGREKHLSFLQYSGGKLCSTGLLSFISFGRCFEQCPLRLCSAVTRGCEFHDSDFGLS